MYGVDIPNDALGWFTLDNYNTVNHSSTAVGDDAWKYGALFYSATSLSENENHTLQFSVGNTDSETSGISSIILDYAVITSNELRSTTSSTSSSTSSSLSQSPSSTCSSFV